MQKQYKKYPDKKIYFPNQFDAKNPEEAKGACNCEESAKWHVHTMHDGQICDLEDKDWVMPEPTEGRYYPIKPDVFKNTYYCID